MSVKREVRDDFPLPALGKYELNSMKVGQCFIFDAENSNEQRNIRSAAYLTGKRSNFQKKFTCRLLEDGRLGVWRTA